MFYLRRTSARLLWEAVRFAVDSSWVFTHNRGVKITAPTLKKCHFLGSALKDIRKFPEDVQGAVGHALHEAQSGLEPLSAKALQGFTGRGILEIVENHDGDTFRAVYTVRFADVIYVLHCFQKKSKKGVATPKHEIDVIKARLQAAEAHYQARVRKGDKP